jgi:hypothetical protein
MNVRILVVAGLLGSVLATSDALAWSSGGHGHPAPTSTSSDAAFTSGGSTSGGGTSTAVDVPEPSSMFAIGSALALVGAAGWMLRRKK